MKINIIGTGLFRSGGMRVIFEYGNLLVENGHNVVYYFPLIPYKYTNKNFLKRTYEILRRLYENIKSFTLFKRKELNLYTNKFSIKPVIFIKNIFIRNADVLIATQWPTAYSVNMLNTTKGRKFYLMQDYEIWNSDKEKVDNSYKLNLKILTVSKYLSLLLQEKFGVNSVSISNGIDFNFFKCENKTYNDKPVITFIDHYLKRKNVDLAVKVITALNESYKGLKYICFGYDCYTKMPDFIKFIKNPTDNQIKEIYAMTDIFLFTSDNEGFGLPPAEAMCSKCAVVTTKVGAIPDYCKDKISAMIIEPGDFEAFFNACIYLIENKAERIGISNNGYNEIKNNLRWHKSYNELIKVISE